MEYRLGGRFVLGLAAALLLGSACASTTVPSVPEPVMPAAEAPVKTTVPESSAPAPEAVPAEEAAPPAPVAPVVPAIPHRITVLSVPFTVQAPYAVWDATHEEACEEASMLMVVDYLADREDLRIPADEAETRILELIDWETEHGYSVDLTAAEVAKVLSERFGVQAQSVRYDVVRARQEISAGRPVIIPAAGRLLGNPYFRQPGPMYHMLVIKGYEDAEFITNDPGTRRGENFRYPESVFEAAVHDWNGGNVPEGEQMMVVIDQGVAVK
jgi:hypothetical protein